MLPKISGGAQNGTKKVEFMKSNTLFRTSEKVRNKFQSAAVKEIKRIAVAGAGRDVGVSLAAGLLSAYIADIAGSQETVSLIEMGSPYFYEAFGIEKRFIHREFLSFYDILNRRGNIKGLSNIEENINWILRCPPKPQSSNSVYDTSVQVRQQKGISPDISLSHSFRLLHNVCGTILIFDCSGMPEDVLWDVLPEMDGIILVIDPMPSRLIPSGIMIQRLRLTMDRTVLVVNKMNKGVHRGELCRFLGTKDFPFLPFVNPESLYKAEYNCMLPYSIPSVKKETEAHIKDMWDAVLQTIQP